MSTKKVAPKKAVKKDSATKHVPKIHLDAALDSRSTKERVHEFLEKEESHYDRDAELMQQAAGQIRSLRDSNNHMSTRLDMFDKMYNIFTNNNGRYGGDKCCGSDIVSNLEYRAKERQEELKSKPQS